MVVMTAWATVNLAVEAMRRGGARFRPETLGKRSRAGDRAHADRTGRHPPPQRAPRSGKQTSCGSDCGNDRPRPRRGPSTISWRAPPRCVRCYGNHRQRRAVGCARAHHRRERHWQGRGGTRAARRQPARAGKPLVSVNMGGLSENVFESELFGHVRGAFTDAKTDRIGRFELADGGTIFLDEIANVPARATGEVAAAAGNRRVRARRALRARRRPTCGCSARRTPTCTRRSPRGRFRQDLLYRLNTVEVRLPPLRARPEDIPTLAAQFPTKIPRTLPQAPRTVSTTPRPPSCNPTPGRATSASWTTPSSGPC